MDEVSYCKRFFSNRNPPLKELKSLICHNTMMLSKVIKSFIGLFSLTQNRPDSLFLKVSCLLHNNFCVCFLSAYSSSCSLYMLLTVIQSCCFYMLSSLHWQRIENHSSNNLLGSNFIISSVTAL